MKFPLGPRRLIATIIAAGFVASLAATPVASVAAASGSTQTLQNLTRIGTSHFVSSPTGLSGDTRTQALPTDTGDDLDTHAGRGPSGPPTKNPNPGPNRITSFNPGFSGFQGLDHFDTRTRDGGNAYSLEPPDQGLCVGNGYVLETINDVMVAFDSAGHRLTAPTSMNTFFNLPYAINRTTKVAGDFLSDPKCLYDAATNRFFLSILQLDPAPSVRSHTFIAVSNSGDPTGSWTAYSIDTTDDGVNGTPSHPGCPCFGDQPLLGADAYGLYISTNEFGTGFNGSQIYAMSKWALAAGGSPTLVHIDAGLIPTPDVGGIWYSVQPATSPSSAGHYSGHSGRSLTSRNNGGGDFDTSHGGTEYFLSALQFGPAPLDNRIAAWAMTNTQSLNRATPSVNLLVTVMRSETYGTPASGNFAATQKVGSIPLGDSLGSPENSLNANDDRMNQVVYAGGLLYSGLNTTIGDAGRTGIAYFVVSPEVSRNGSAINAYVARQGYVAAARNNVLFPSIGVNTNGNAVMTFTLSGPDYYPTSAYADFNARSGAGAIHIAGLGSGPADGFTGYPAYGGNRWSAGATTRPQVAAPTGRSGSRRNTSPRPVLTRSTWRTPPAAVLAPRLPTGQPSSVTSTSNRLHVTSLSCR